MGNCSYFPFCDHKLCFENHLCLFPCALKLVFLWKRTSQLGWLSHLPGIYYLLSTFLSKDVKQDFVTGFEFET